MNTSVQRLKTYFYREEESTQEAQLEKIINENNLCMIEKTSPYTLKFKDERLEDIFFHYAKRIIYLDFWYKLFCSFPDAWIILETCLLLILNYNKLNIGICIIVIIITSLSITIRMIILYYIKELHLAIQILFVISLGINFAPIFLTSGSLEKNSADFQIYIALVSIINFFYFNFLPNFWIINCLLILGAFIIQAIPLMIFYFTCSVANLISILGWIAFISLIVISLRINSIRERKTFLFIQQIINKNKEFKKILDLLSVGICILDNNQIIYKNSPFSLLICSNDLDKSDVDHMKDFIPINKGNEEKYNNLWDFLKSPENFNYKRVFANSEAKEIEVNSLEMEFANSLCKVAILNDISNINADKLMQIRKNYEQLLISSLTHQIRTPLNGVFGSIEIIENKIKDNLPEISYLIDKIKVQANIMLYHINDVNDYFLIKNNSLKILNKVFSVPEAVNTMYFLFKDEINGRNLKFNINLDESVPKYVNNDKEKYMQILINLISNSIKYTFEGSIDLTITYNNTSMLLSTILSDSGIGIKP